MGGLVRIHADDDQGVRVPFVGVGGNPRRTIDFKYLSQQLAVTPLFSHAANADRRGDTPQEGQPELRVTRIPRVIPSGRLRHAMGCNPTHRAVILIQVGNYVTADN